MNTTVTWMGPMLVLAVLAAGAAGVQAVPMRDNRSGATFPRIANCYGAGLGWRTWDEGAEYWSKLDLFIGGGYDLHYDWENPRWEGVLARVEENVHRLREVNPTARVLPYVDVVEGPDSSNVPEHWWDLRDGERWSGWPGYFRVNTKLPEVLQFNLDKVREEILGRACFDGVFYDCWGPDSWLVPRTARLRDGRAVVMVNDWNLPTRGFSSLNGCLAEDELNRVVEGKVDFEDFLARYLRWSEESRKPAVTTIVCHPRGLDMDAWRWARVSWQERNKLREGFRDADLQMMRFGLATALMGNGYFAFDCANLGRGDWWWYPEYDAPLGYPTAPARRNADGTWQRTFDNGLVVTNGSFYDAVFEPGGRFKDLSTGRIATSFTVPAFDGRILVPSSDPLTPGPDIAPRMTATPPRAMRAARLDDGTIVAQTPHGLDLRFSPAGELRSILLNGRSVMSGGWPIVAAPPMSHFAVEPAGPGQFVAAPSDARLEFRGSLTHGEQSATFVETVVVRPNNEFVLRFDFRAETALDLRMWRHCFMLPASAYAGGTASAGRQRLTLPEELGVSELLAASDDIRITGRWAALEVRASPPMGLVDHRRWGTPDYLLASYPVGGHVTAGTEWTVEIATTVRPAAAER